MNILLVGKTSSVNTTLKTMLEAKQGWSVRQQSDLDSSGFSGNDLNLMIANLEDFYAPSVDIISHLCECYPGTPLLAIHSYSDQALIQPMLAAGATGYIKSEISEEQLIEAATKVAAHQKHVIADFT